MNVLDRVFNLAERRDELLRTAPPCPVCGTEQVQLMDYSAVPAQWRCRRCGAGFEQQEKPWT